MGDDPTVLLQKATNGDPLAIDELLHRHLPGLHAYVRLRAGPSLRQYESSADLVQSVCRDLLENLHRYRHGGEAGFKQWLFTTAARKIADRCEYLHAAKRDVRRRAPQAEASEDEQMLLAQYRCLVTPSRAAVAREELARVERAFAHLPENYREVILLAKIVGLSRAEIGERLGKTENAVRNLLVRALAVLSEHLGEEDELTGGR